MWGIWRRGWGVDGWVCSSLLFSSFLLSLSLSLSLLPSLPSFFQPGLIQEFDFFASHDLDCAEDTENATVSYLHACIYATSYNLSYYLPYRTQWRWWLLHWSSWSTIMKECPSKSSKASVIISYTSYIVIRFFWLLRIWEKKERERCCVFWGMIKAWLIYTVLHDIKISFSPLNAHILCILYYNSVLFNVPIYVVTHSLLCVYNSGDYGLALMVC